MSDTYRAIYDAARDAFQLGNLPDIVAYKYITAAEEQQRPSVLFRPTLSIDGNMYCAMYGDDIAQGCAGFGETAEAAMRDFDQNWRETKATHGIVP